MIQLLPEPKMAEDFEKTTININAIYFCGEISDELRKLARERFWNYQDIKINEASEDKVKDIDYNGLVKMIIGRELENVYPPINENLGDIILEVRNLTAPKAFRNINIKVREGEVVGIAGLLGAGKTELVQAIFGNHKIVDGEVLVKGKPVKIKSPQQAIKLGMGLVPDERRTLGLVMKFDIKFTVCIISGSC